ncbi:MAG: zinc-ribbon domain-containing protein [Anaerolineae bacterium]
MAICPNCGNKTSEGAIFCDQCGTRLPQPETAIPEADAAPAGGSVICPACGAGNVPGEAFCDYCGSPLEAPAPAAAEPGEAEPAPATEPPAAEETEAPTELTCPACGAPVLAGEVFCANCGASLAQPPIPPEPVAVEAEEPEPEQPAEAETPAEAEAEPAAVEAPPPSPAAVPDTTCPACGAEVEPGDTFCSTCGYALREAETSPREALQAAVTPPPPAPAPGLRFVITASGAEIPLPEKEEILIGREDPVSGVYPDVDLTPHGGEEGGVSRRHARLIAEGGKFYVEDLDSTNFTFVNKQKVAPKARQQVSDGDEIRFGRVEVALRTG